MLNTNDLYSSPRKAMIERHLRRRGIVDLRVLAAMLAVPREKFVPKSFKSVAYHDGALPIGRGQTISQPFTVAYMCQALLLQGQERVLEVGTGSGYGAAVLSRLAHQVFTIERIAEFAELARERLARLGYDNVDVRAGDGSRGLPDEAPFDAIVVTAAAPGVPRALVEQLIDGGRLIIPVERTFSAQTLYRITKDGEGFSSEDLGGFAFVPLIPNSEKDES